MDLSVTALSRAALLGASRNAALQDTALRFGMRLGAGRFVAGETIDDFCRAAKRLQMAGFRISAAILGECTREATEARGVANAYMSLLARIGAEGIDANVALKPTHLGYDVDASLATRLLHEVLAAAKAHGNTLRLDMEESRYVTPTLDLYRDARAAGFDNVGVVLQSCLYRSRDDLEALLPLVPNIRLVKGAYLEPASVAHQRKADVDEALWALIERGLGTPGFTAIATHDDRIIERTIAHVERLGIGAAAKFEFQMLFGIRTDLQRGVVRRGYPVRISAPYGRDWFPYFMRRLAERPANLQFVASSVARSLLAGGE
jgi:proline dehydrogenase